MPRANRLAVLTCARATQGLDIPKDTPVIGVTLQGSQETGELIWKSLFNEKRMISPRWGATVTQSSICTTVSRHLNLTGPSFMINQACSAFITAIDIAEKFLNSGSECVILFAVDCATHPYTTYIFNSMGVYTKEMVKPFGVDRSGMALGEGATCYVLTKENRARKKLGSIGRTSLYNDYYNLTAPNPEGVAGKFLLKELTEAAITEPVLRRFVLTFAVVTPPAGENPPDKFNEVNVAVPAFTLFVEILPVLLILTEVRTLPKSSLPTNRLLK